ncbi:MAG: DUF397 domain-containing protein [Micromonosporaceae bacterium]|nr:DUF397 domain-containing protein [Micromonosporaceae bacterium]
MNRAWRKSQHSHADACVEIAWDPEGVRVRDSKHPGGPVLHFTWVEWKAFVTGVKEGEFDGPALIDQA